MPHSLALNQSHPPRRARFIPWAKLGGTSLLVGYVLVTAGIGLRQQTPGLPPEAIDCDYRAQLLRHRLVSHLERSDNAPSRAHDADLEFSTLLRETRDSCIGAPQELVDQLDEIQSSYESFQLRKLRDAEARQQLLAL